MCLNKWRLFVDQVEEFQVPVLVVSSFKFQSDQFDLTTTQELGQKFTFFTSDILSYLSSENVEIWTASLRIRWGSVGYLLLNPLIRFYIYAYFLSR